MKQFKQLIDEFDGTRRAVFTFGRMNPPTNAHEMLCETVVQEADVQEATPFIFLSQTVDTKRNPLSFEEKLRYLRLGLRKKVFDNIQENLTIRTPFDALRFLEEQGYTHVTMVVGTDRLIEFDSKLQKYNGKEFNFKQIDVISCGSRDPDLEGTLNISASMLRECVIDDDFQTFSKNTLSGLSSKFAEEMFNNLKTKLLTETTETVHMTDTLDVKRENLISSQQVAKFLSFLLNKNIQTHFSEIGINELKPVQCDLDQNVLDAKVKEYIKNGYKEPIIMSEDFHIIDGHHRWAAIKTIEPQCTVYVRVIETNISNILNLLSSFKNELNELSKITMNEFETDVLKRLGRKEDK